MGFPDSRKSPTNVLEYTTPSRRTETNEVDKLKFSHLSATRRLSRLDKGHLHQKARRASLESIHQVVESEAVSRDIIQLETVINSWKCKYIPEMCPTSNTGGLDFNDHLAAA